MDEKRQPKSSQSLDSCIGGSSGKQDIKVFADSIQSLSIATFVVHGSTVDNVGKDQNDFLDGKAQLITDNLIA